MGARDLSWDGYATAWASRHGGFDPRRASGLIRSWLRTAYGIARVLARIRISPGAVRGTALVLNLAVPLAAAALGPWPAAALALVGAMTGTVDGALALISSQATWMGYLYDALGDRVAEACWLAALWLLGAPVGLVVLAGALAWLYEYVRARVATMGLTAAGALTVGKRTTRLTLTVVGMAIAGVAASIDYGVAAGVVTLTAVIWVFVGATGLAQLLSAVRKSLEVMQVRRRA